MRRFAACVSGLVAGLALAVRPAGLAEATLGPLRRDGLRPVAGLPCAAAAAPEGFRTEGAAKSCRPATARPPAIRLKIIPAQHTNPLLSAKRPQQDSNLRSRLRRAHAPKALTCTDLPSNLTHGDRLGIDRPGRLTRP